MKTLVAALFTAILVLANIEASASGKKAKSNFRTTTAAMAVLNDASSRWTVMTAVGPRLSGSDYHSMKRISNDAGIDVRKKINIKTLKNNEFLLTDYNLKVKISSDFKKLHVKNLVFQIKPRDGFAETYQNISVALAGAKSTAQWYHLFFMSEANAEVSSDQSAGYDLATILYYMKVYNDSDGQLMDDFYKADAIERLREKHKSGKTKVSFKCNKNGLVATFNDGRVAYIGNNGDLVEKQKDGKAEKVTNADANIVSEGRKYYCDMLSNSEDGGVDGEVSLKQMTVDTPIDQ